MRDIIDQRCVNCGWLNVDKEPPCGRYFAAHMHVMPIGGTIDVSFTPGMVPKELEDKLAQYLGKCLEWLAAVIQQCPIWEEIGEIMRSNPQKTDCPGREEFGVEFVKVVKH